MEDMEYLKEKRIKVLKAIKPICDVFEISDYDYIIKESGQTETLRIYDVKIGCSCNSIDAVKNELIGFIFLQTFARDRSLGAFDTQTRNVIKRYWIESKGE